MTEMQKGLLATNKQKKLMAEKSSEKDTQTTSEDKRKKAEAHKNA